MLPGGSGKTVIGLGVAMEGHVIDWPGPYSFFRRNLAYDWGFWPEKMVCTSPKAPWIDSGGLCRNVGIFGINNGNCCAAYDANIKMLRKTVLMILKTVRARRSHLDLALAIHP